MRTQYWGAGERCVHRIRDTFPYLLFMQIWLAFKDIVKIEIIFYKIYNLV